MKRQRPPDDPDEERGRLLHAALVAEGRTLLEATAWPPAQECPELTGVVVPLPPPRWGHRVHRGTTMGGVAVVLLEVGHPVLSSLIDPATAVI